MVVFWRLRMLFSCSVVLGSVSDFVFRVLGLRKLEEFLGF